MLDRPRGNRTEVPAFARTRHGPHACKARLGEVELVGIAGADRPLVTPSQKQALFAATGAAAADMESHVAARAAAKHGLPFAVLRVVADPAERGLPPAALAGMASRRDHGPDGGVRSLAKSPRQFAQLIRVAADACRAYVRATPLPPAIGTRPRPVRSRLACSRRAARRRILPDAGDRAGSQAPSARRS